MGKHYPVGEVVIAKWILELAGLHLWQLVIVVSVHLRQLFPHTVHRGLAGAVLSKKVPDGQSVFG